MNRASPAAPGTVSDREPSSRNRRPAPPRLRLPLWAHIAGYLFVCYLGWGGIFYVNQNWFSNWDPAVGPDFYSFFIWPIYAPIMLGAPFAAYSWSRSERGRARLLWALVLPILISMEFDLVLGCFPLLWFAWILALSVVPCVHGCRLALAACRVDGSPSDQRGLRGHRSRSNRA